MKYQFGTASALIDSIRDGSSEIWFILNALSGGVFPVLV